MLKGSLRPSWTEYFMFLAKTAATRSTCLSRPVGAVLVKDRQVLATGYNGPISGVDHCTDDGECFRRSGGEIPDSKKHLFCRANHAEANVIAQAAKHGINTQGASLYITLYPCYTCHKLLHTAGIKRVYYESKYTSVNVDDSFNKELIENGDMCFNELTIRGETLRYIMKMVTRPTSIRKLKSE